MAEETVYNVIEPSYEEALLKIQQVQIEFYSPLSDVFEESANWADVTELEERKIKEGILRGVSERGRKLFIGNIPFTSSNPEKPDAADTLRITAVLLIFLQFGQIDTIRLRVDKRYCFVVYHEKSHASAALKYMTKHENRVKSVEQARTCVPDQFPADSLPKPNFYCRWPKDSRCPKNPRAQKRKQHPRQKTKQSPM
jgi:RNA recognition motif-containing protein